jgi:hypothetical protein
LLLRGPPPSDHNVSLIFAFGGVKEAQPYRGEPGISLESPQLKILSGSLRMMYLTRKMDGTIRYQSKYQVLSLRLLNFRARTERL